MPRRALTVCGWRGCSTLVRGRYCPPHAAAARQQREARVAPIRAERHRLYGKQWRRLRNAQLNAEPWCRECHRAGRRRPASEVDHIRPHLGDETLFFDETNLQSLCRPCHSRKTAREVGFAGARRRASP